QGRWRRLADVPFPSGKNKTVIVDLTGKFLSADHHVRIRTNMEIYWDQAFVAAARARTSSSITVLDPATADLHYRGFSRLYRKGGRYGPEWAAYEDVSRESPWEPIVGRYTRYGDVLPLVRAPDDMYVIIAPGDETTLTFDASAAPPLPPGWTRDFLLYTDAWLKDSERNTAMGAKDLEHVPAPHEVAPRRRVAVGAWQMKGERVGEPVVDIEQHTDVNRVLDRGIAHAGGAEWLYVRRPHFRRGERELLEQAERGSDFGIDPGGAPIGQHRLDQLLVPKGQRRDRAVGTRSEQALVQARRERGEQLALADAPFRRPAHHRLRPVAHRATEELRPVEQRFDDVGHATPTHQADEEELEPLRQAMT